MICSNDGYLETDEETSLEGEDIDDNSSDLSSLEGKKSASRTFETNVSHEGGLPAKQNYGSPYPCKKSAGGPSPILKAYSPPFHAYFSKLLREDTGAESAAEDSLQYSPSSTVDISVWKEVSDVESSIGGSPPKLAMNDSDGTNTTDDIDDPKTRALQLLKEKARQNAATLPNNKRLVHALRLSALTILLLLVTVAILGVALARANARIREDTSDVNLQAPVIFPPTMSPSSSSDTDP